MKQGLVTSGSNEDHEKRMILTHQRAAYLKEAETVEAANAHLQVTRPCLSVDKHPQWATKESWLRSNSEAAVNEQLQAFVKMNSQLVIWEKLRSTPVATVMNGQSQVKPPPDLSERTHYQLAT